jgi:pimeloyl-ACP methyl ester carboxylesterase
LNDRRFLCQHPAHPKIKMNKLFSLATALACLTALTGCITRTTPPASPTSPASLTPASGQPFTCVLVHGAWGGGWDWKHVADLLTADGNTVFRPTLTGQGEHSNLASTNLDLDTHIQDIVNVILWENLHDVVLVGHSYGGMVITGVADRVPDRIKHLIYVDAILPENGESVDTIMPSRIKFPVVDGLIPPAWVKGNPPPPHDVPMSARSFSQPITLTNQPAARNVHTTYILTVDKGRPPEQDDFYRFYQRAQARGWPALIMEGDHNVQRSHPQELVRLIEHAP